MTPPNSNWPKRRSSTSVNALASALAFLDDVRAAIKIISEFAEGSPLLQGRIRRKVLLRFPYALMYSLRNDQIRILAVAHEKRRPFYWRGRR